MSNGDVMSYVIYHTELPAVHHYKTGISSELGTAEPVESVRHSVLTFEKPSSMLQEITKAL